MSSLSKNYSIILTETLKFFEFSFLVFVSVDSEWCFCCEHIAEK